jgi:hypothetical protein
VFPCFKRITNLSWVLDVFPTLNFGLWASDFLSVPGEYNRTRNEETRIHGWRGAGANAKTKQGKVCPLLGEWCQAEVRQQVREYVNLKSVNSVSTGRPSFGLRVFVTLLFNIYPSSRRLSATPKTFPNSRSVLDCGGKRSATPLSSARHAVEQRKTFVRIKAVLKPPHSRRWRDQQTPQPARSVWTAACLPPLSSAQHAIEQIKTFVRSKAVSPLRPKSIRETPCQQASRASAFASLLLCCLIFTLPPVGWLKKICRNLYLKPRKISSN